MPKCQGCGAEIRFAPRPNGKNIPLQAVRSVYLIDSGGVAQQSALTGVYISHFETCPKASNFSRRKK